MVSDVENSLAGPLALGLGVAFQLYRGSSFLDQPVDHCIPQASQQASKLHQNPRFSHIREEPTAFPLEALWCAPVEVPYTGKHGDDDDWIVPLYCARPVRRLRSAGARLEGRNFPQVTRWGLKGAGFTLLYFGLATYLPLLRDAWLGEHRLFAADTLPLWGQIAGGVLVVELGVYAWHRTMHATPFLWRWFHQMHHSAERIDVWGAFYFSPLDIFGWTLLTSLALVLGFGVSAEAAIVVGVITTFMGMFQHANIKTPHWRSASSAATTSRR